MNINIRTNGIELTEAIRSYVEEKFNSLEKFGKDLMLAEVEVGKTTNHHQKGDIFSCSATLTIHGDVVKMEREAEDLYKAIDKVRDHLREALAERKDRAITNERRNSQAELPSEEPSAE